MSGTSADGIDAALVEWPDDATVRPFRLVSFVSIAHPDELQQRIHALAAQTGTAKGALTELASLDGLLADRFADAARAAAEAAGIGLDAVDAIASHGQTVGHFPELAASLQIGDPSRIAERTGCDVVADFRARDLAAGGEGAPLAPFFHWAVLSGAAEHRVALNLGGIANLTWLPKSGDPDEVVAFDTGPANALIDAVVQLTSEGRERMDRDGAAARRGSVVAGWLQDLLESDEYLRRPPPKSTGREHYGLAEARALVARAQREAVSVDDLVATLTAFTAESVGRACREFLPGAPERLLVGGGGAENPTLMDGLRGSLPGVAIETFETAGIPTQAAEAMAFSLMGRNTLLGAANHLPRTTGAAHACVLGEVAYASGAPRR